MQADWEVEIGGDAHVIEAFWPGFVDLGRDPGRVNELIEVRDLPALAETLLRLNAAGSPVWTSKCDLWPVDGSDRLDPYELDAPAGLAEHAWACYLDLLARERGLWPEPASAVEWSRMLAGRLRSIPLDCSRADLVVRLAVFGREETGVGVTVYLTGCGETTERARLRLGDALGSLRECIPGVHVPGKAPLRLQ